MADVDHADSPADQTLDVVLRHLALVAIDGATDEVALTMSPTFRLHVDDLTTDRSGYLALIEANHAAHATRPPLDVVRAAPASSSMVTLCLEPRCVMHARVDDAVLTAIWMTSDWKIWEHWLLRHALD